MEVIFRNRDLERNYVESRRAIQQWGPEVGPRYIVRIDALYGAKNFEEASKIRAMRLHPLKGKRYGKWAVWLTVRFRLIISKGDSEEQVIIEGVSKHYGD